MYRVFLDCTWYWNLAFCDDNTVGEDTLVYDAYNLEIKWSSFGKAVKVFLMAPGYSVQKAAQRLLSRPNV